MVAQHNSAASFLAGDSIQIAAAQSRTQRTHRSPCGDLIHDDGICVLIFNPMGHAHFCQKLRQHGGWKIWLALVKVAGQKIHRQQSAPLQLMQDGQQGIAVLAARKAHQPTAAWFNHSIFFNCFARFAQDPLAQFAKFGGAGGAVKERVDIVGVIQHGRPLGVVFVWLKRAFLAVNAALAAWGHRIIAGPAPWMTAPQAAQHQKGAAPRAVPFQRFKGIDRTGGLKSAAMANPWAEQKPIGTNRKRDQMGQWCHGVACTRSSARFKSACISAKSRVAVAVWRPTST